MFVCWQHILWFWNMPKNGLSPESSLSKKPLRQRYSPQLDFIFRDPFCEPHLTRSFFIYTLSQFDGYYWISELLQWPQDQGQLKGLAALNSQASNPFGSWNNFYIEFFLAFWGLQIREYVVENTTTGTIYTVSVWIWADIKIKYFFSRHFYYFFSWIALSSSQ